MRRAAGRADDREGVDLQKTFSDDDLRAANKRLFGA
jgi:hypothetical protein